MSRILHYGDSPFVATGYGVQARGILRALLAAGHEITSVGLSAARDVGHLMPDGMAVLERSVRGCDPYGFDALADEATRHDVVLSICDPQLAPPREVLGSKRAVHYSGTDWPIDTGSENHSNVQAHDVVIAANRYGRLCLGGAEVIPHGHDLQTFRPGERGARAELGLDEGDVLLVNVAQNTPKKNLGALIAAFSVFQHDLRNAGRRAVLYLHTCPIASVPPWGSLIDLGAAVRGCGLEIGRDVMFPGEAPPFGAGSSAEDIARILRAADAFVSSSLSEGWCLPMTEAMACGTPVIVPGHTVFPELASERGWIYPVDGRAVVPALDGAERPIVSPPAILVGLRAWWHAERRDLVRPVTERARAFVETLGWDRIGPRWQELFRRITG